MMRSPAVLLLLMMSVAAVAAEDAVMPSEALDGRVQQLKNELLELSTDISRVERQIYPERSTVSVFFRVDEGEASLPGSTVVRLDGRVVGAHIYEDAERRALVEGGVQPLYRGFITSGDHEITISMITHTEDGASEQLSAVVEFTKLDRSVLLEAVLNTDAADGRGIDLREY